MVNLDPKMKDDGGYRHYLSVDGKDENKMSNSSGASEMVAITKGGTGRSKALTFKALEQMMKDALAESNKTGNEMITQKTKVIANEFIGIVKNRFFQV